MARLSMFGCDTPVLSIIKWLITLFNLIFWTLGALSIIIGIYLYVQSKYALFTDDRCLFQSTLLIGTGFGVLVIGFVGIVSAVWESKLLLNFFVFITSVVAGLYLTVGTWTLIQSRNDIIADKQLIETMAEYDKTFVYKELWDDIQVKHQCCGSNSWRDWRGKISSRVIPDSCCVDYSSQCGVSIVPMSKFHEKGCLSVIVQHNHCIHDTIGPAGLVVSILQIPGIILSIVLHRMLSTYKKSYCVDADQMVVV